MNIAEFDPVLDENLLSERALGPLAEKPLGPFLGTRAAKVFRALHGARLEALLASALTAPESGRLLWLLGRGDDARARLVAAARAEPAPPRTLGYLGVASIAQDPVRALACFDAARRGDPAWPWPALWEGLARLHLPGPLEPALEAFDRFIATAPAERAAAHTIKTIAFLSTSRHAEAAREAGEIVAAAPGLADGFSLRLHARLALGDLPGAFTDYGDARDRNPDTGSADLCALGLVALDHRSSAEHLAALEAALARFPHAAFLYAEKGEVLRGPDYRRQDLALACFLRAAELEPDRAWIQAHLGRVERHIAGAEKGLERLDCAAALFPEGGWIHAWRGETLRLLERPDEALAAFDRAQALSPWFPLTYLWRGALLVSLGRFEAARSGLDIAVALAPENAPARRQRGLARRALNDAAGAEADFAQASALDPKYEMARMTNA